MAFTQHCFIRKNTLELRKKLEELGYTNVPNGRGEWFIPIEELKYLITYPESGYYQGCNGYWYKDDFNCGTNEELFLALAAMRDDCDYMQWFICDDNESMFKVDAPDMSMPKFIHEYMDGWDVSGARKATVEEIIEHFKDR